MEAPSKYTYAGGRQDPASNKYVKENSRLLDKLWLKMEKIMLIDI